jgi:hypothetical protein
VLSILNNPNVFAKGKLYGLHIKQVGGCPCEDNRSFTGVLGPGSLQVVRSRATGKIYVDVDRFNPYQNFWQFIGHVGEVLYWPFRREGP